jgi:endonuclease/exonuclease/phosphatase family metal-dependent hydrolase
MMLEHNRQRTHASGSHEPELHVATYNIHKGFSKLNRRMTVHELREQLRNLGPDIVFLQEVQDLHHGHALRHHDWPAQEQSRFLADSVWEHSAYGRNAEYDEGHHGNAILSRFPIVSTENEDISSHRFERRGLLHCEVAVPGWKQHLHCVCVHLALGERGRRQQLRALASRVARLVPHDAPLIVAGDFNDWRDTATPLLLDELHLQEAFHSAHGRLARSFPSGMPLLALDRIYVRGFTVHTALAMQGRAWARISDHAALSARLRLGPR